MEENKLHKSGESTGPLLIKQSIILALHERSCTLCHCQRPDENGRISITGHSSQKGGQLTLGILDLSGRNLRLVLCMAYW